MSTSESTDKRCYKCKVDFDGENIIGCDGNCNGWFHLKCAKVNENQYTVIKTCRGIKWYCNACFERSEVRILKEVNNLRNAIENMGAMLRNEKTHRAENKMNKSYANIVENQINNTVVIQSKDNNKLSDTRIKEVLRTEVNPTELAIGIKSIKSIKNKGVAITCSNEEEKQKLQLEVEKKLGNQLIVPEIQKRGRRLKIIGLEDELSEEQIKCCVLEQNRNLNIGDCDLKLIVNKKRQYGYISIVELNEDAYVKIINEGKLKLKWQICKVYPHSSVYRCFKCYGFNHKAENCSKQEICHKCCENKHEGLCTQVVKCRNCHDANQKHNLNLNVNHSVFDNNCETLKRHIERIENRIVINTHK